MTDRPAISPATVSPPPPSGRPRVVLLRTAPETVLDDYGKLMRSAGYAEILKRDAPTALTTERGRKLPRLPVPTIPIPAIAPVVMPRK